MTKLLSFPMYDVHRPDTQALWSSLLPLLAQEGLAAERLSIVWPDRDLPSHWQDENLLLSQTCGYPLMTQLPDVQLVGAFHYGVAGCDERAYSSLLVARLEDAQSTIEEFSGRRAVCNSADSHSGYNALRSTVAPLARQGRFFSDIILSGSHRQSLLALRQSKADIAAIDCVSWALFMRHEPEALRDLIVIGQTAFAPGLPLITSPRTPHEALFSLRRALRRLVTEPVYKKVCEPLFIVGFSEAARRDYEVILDWQRQAEVHGLRW